MARYIIPKKSDIDWNNHEIVDSMLEEVINRTRAGEYHPSFFNEATGPALIDDSKQSIPQMFAFLKDYVINRHGTDVKQLQRDAATAKDMMVKIEYMEKSDKFKRFIHGGDLVPYTDKFPYLYYGKQKKYYNITADQMFYNPDWMIEKIDNIMEVSNTFNGKEKYDYMKREMDSAKQLFIDDFDKNHWFIIETDPTVKIVMYKNIKFSAAYKYAVNTSKSLYKYMSYVENLSANELVYLQYYEKVYERMNKSYGMDKEAKKLIDDFFKLLLHNESLSIEFNTKIINVTDESFRSQYDELCKLYDKIQQA